MKILLVNDDGIRGEGLVALVKELYGKHDLRVVAPKGECSGNSHHLTFNRAIAVTKTTIPGYEDVPAYYVDGTPADCSRIALTELFDDMPDLCISGINKGPNLGVNIHWSGTLGAAVQATEHGVRRLPSRMYALSLPALNMLQSLQGGLLRSWMDSAFRSARF